MSSKKLTSEEKFSKIDFDLFEALNALDKKDYTYYDRLTTEQQRKFVPYLLILWMSCVKGNVELQSYYVLSTEYHANKYLFNENVQKFPKLQWLMLCAASPGLGKQFHQFIPHIKERISLLKESAKKQDLLDYYKKIYKTLNVENIDNLATDYVKNQNRKFYISEIYPTLKLADIETLNALITDEDILQYEKDRGN